jgi:hypothetical protein
MACHALHNVPDIPRLSNGQRHRALGPHNYERDVISRRPSALVSLPRHRSNARKATRSAKGAKPPSVPPNLWYLDAAGTWMQRTGATVKDAHGASTAGPDQALNAYMREIPACVRTAVDARDGMFTEWRNAEAKPVGTHK